MPAPVYRGIFPAVKRQSWEQTKDGKFLYSITNAYKANNNVVTGVLGSSLATYGRLFYLTNIDLVTENAITEVTLEYTSSLAQQETPTGTLAALTIYESSSVLSEDPISTHPAFTAATGIFESSIVSASGQAITEGTGASGGAIFSEDGIFVGFTKTALNNFFGVQSYLSPKVTFRKTIFRPSVPSVSYTQQVGYIHNPPKPDQNAPSLTAGQNWLFTNLSWRNSGSVSGGMYEITEEYTASGINGWNDTIYKEAT